MTARTNPAAAAPQLMQQLIEYGETLRTGGLEPSLVRLIALRASQINGSAAGLHRYLAEARRDGADNDQLDLLVAWRDCDALYTAREQAALAWTEALTRLSDTGAPDDAYAAVQAHFSDEEQVRLTLVISIINTFNRLAVGHRLRPAVQPRAQAA